MAIKTSVQHIRLFQPAADDLFKLINRQEGTFFRAPRLHLFQNLRNRLIAGNFFIPSLSSCGK